MKKTYLENALQRYDAGKGIFRKIFGDTSEIQSLRAIYNRSSIQRIDLQDELPDRVVTEIGQIALYSTRTSGLTHDIMEDIKLSTTPILHNKQEDVYSHEDSITLPTLDTVEVKTEKKPYLPTRKDIAFLIEGCIGSNDSRFPDVMNGVNIAKANSCDFFDVIASFDVKHLSEALKETLRETRKCLY